MSKSLRAGCVRRRKILGFVEVVDYLSARAAEPDESSWDWLFRSRPLPNEEIAGMFVGFCSWTYEHLIEGCSANVMLSRRVHPYTSSQLEGVEGPHLGEKGPLWAHLRGMVSYVAVTKNRGSNLLR